MDFAVLPGPSLPELARTALVRATTAAVCGYASQQVPIRAGRDGSPLLLPATGSPLGRWLASGPDAVTVSVPASTPFAELRIAGTPRPSAPVGTAGVTAFAVAIRSVQFTGRPCVQVPVDDYRASVPDPLWSAAPGVLRHLEHCHMTELVQCVRAHGMTTATAVVPRGLDRYGLEFLVLTADGVAAVRLAFPDGPVASLRDVPASIRATLTCRCQAGPGHRHTRPAQAE